VRATASAGLPLESAPFAGRLDVCGEPQLPGEVAERLKALAC
jgi:hypothetical protein